MKVLHDGFCETHAEHEPEVVQRNGMSRADSAVSMPEIAMNGYA